MANKKLTFTFVRYDLPNGAIGRVVVIEDGEVIAIFETTLRKCINYQLKVLHDRGIIDEKFRLRKGDK